jgi:hypothetical protein
MVEKKTEFQLTEVAKKQRWLAESATARISYSGEGVFFNRRLRVLSRLCYVFSDGVNALTGYGGISNNGPSKPSFQLTFSSLQDM